MSDDSKLSEEDEAELRFALGGDLVAEGEEQRLDMRFARLARLFGERAETERLLRDDSQSSARRAECEQLLRDWPNILALEEGGGYAPPPEEPPSARALMAGVEALARQSHAIAADHGDAYDLAITRILEAARLICARQLDASADRLSQAIERGVATGEVQLSDLQQLCDTPDCPDEGFQRVDDGKELEALTLSAEVYLATAEPHERFVHEQGLTLPAGRKRTRAVRALLTDAGRCQRMMRASRDDLLTIGAAQLLIRRARSLGLADGAHAEGGEWLTEKLRAHTPRAHAIASWVLQATGHDSKQADNLVTSALRNLYVLTKD
jgi:hypothetical protein